MYVLKCLTNLENCRIQSEVKLFKEFDNAVTEAKKDSFEHVKSFYEGDLANIGELQIESDKGEYLYSVYISDCNMNSYRISVRPIDFEENQIQGGKDDEWKVNYQDGRSYRDA